MQISVTLPSLLAFILTTNYVTAVLTFLLTRRESKHHSHSHSH